MQSEWGLINEEEARRIFGMPSAKQTKELRADDSVTETEEENEGDEQW